MRRCIKCKRQLPANCFRTKATTPGEWLHWCRECRGEIPVAVSRVVTPKALKIQPMQPGASVGLQVSAILASFNTADLTRDAIESLHTAYPDMPIVAIDNGSMDDSRAVLKILEGACGIKTIYNTVNVGHGPALCQALRLTDTPYFLTMDSDCKVLKAGFIEAMLARFEQTPMLYALGWLRIVNRESGVPNVWYVGALAVDQFCRYVHPACALHDRVKYETLPPFFHHGAISLLNMQAAQDKGYALESFPIFEYVSHLEAGTRRRYEGRWDPSSVEPLGAWRLSDHHPI